MAQRKANIASAFSNLGLSRPSTAQSTDTSVSTASSSSRNHPFYHHTSSSSTTSLQSSSMNPNTSTLHPRGGPSPLEHKTSSTSIRSLLNEPVLDPQLQTTDRRPSEDPSRLTPTRDQRSYTSEETPRQAGDFPRGPSSGAHHTTAQSRYREQDRKLSGGSEGEGSSRGSVGPQRPRSTVSDTSSRFEYPFPTPTSTASITLQQAYHGVPTPIVPDMYSTMPSKAIQSTGSSRAPISRATKACNACRSRKVRCDAGGPKSSAAGEELPCTRCKDSGIQCVYTGSQRKRGPAPGANRPVQRRKPSSLELDLGPTLGLAVPPDMSRTRSASSITAGNGHYHPYAQPGSLPSPPSASRIASRPGNEYPPYPTNERFEYGRPAPLSYDRPFTGVPRPPLTAPLTGYPPRDYEYRHSISGEVPHPRSHAAYGYPPQDLLARHPPPPPPGAHPAYLGSRQTYPTVDPSLQVESQRPSTALSGWQGGGAPSPSLRVPSEQEPSRHHDAAAYQAGYEAALREARIAAKVEAQHQEQDRRDREREWERERMMQAEREGRAVPALAPPSRGFEEPSRPPYWERSEPRGVKVDERIPVEERERMQRRDVEIAAVSREHRLPEMNTRVTLPPIQQMDRSLAL